MLNVKAVLFDLDGTLLYTLEDLYISTNYALSYFNYPNRTLEEVRCFVGNGVRRLIELAIFPHTNIDEVLDKFKEHYSIHAFDHILVYPGIYDLLNLLKEQGIILGVVSNKYHNAVKDIVNKYFPNTFDYILGEKEGIKKKPFPDMIYHTIDNIKLSLDECIYVGDSEVDIEVGRNASIKTIICSWGFRTKEELKEASIIIDNPSELLRLL